MRFFRRSKHPDSEPAQEDTGPTRHELIGLLTYADRSAAGTWSKRRDAAGQLGGLGDPDSVVPLYSGLRAAIGKMREIHEGLTPAELTALSEWPLTVLPETHTEDAYRSMGERGGGPLALVHIGEFEWAWAAAVIHAEALGKLGEAAAGQELVSELQGLEGSRWKEAESLLRQAGAP